MQNDPLSEKQSLDLIEEMIITAKQEQIGAAFYFILWGILTFIYAICMFLAVYYKIQWLAYSWVLFPIGGVLSILRVKRDDRIEKTKSISDRVYGFVWGAAGFYICVIISFGMKIGAENVMPLIILMYALASFITGGITKYYPSVFGSLFCAVCAVFAFIFDVQYQFLLCAAAITGTHIIPGLMMKNYYKQKMNAE